MIFILSAPAPEAASRAIFRTLSVIAISCISFTLHLSKLENRIVAKKSPVPQNGTGQILSVHSQNDRKTEITPV
jgi:hypothetical protein